MTSFAFIMGVLPMAVSTGAGANARHALGTGVIGGMLFATFLGLLLIPVFSVVVRRLLGDTLDEAPEDTPAIANESVRVAGVRKGPRRRGLLLDSRLVTQNGRECGGVCGCSAAWRVWGAV